MAINDGGPAFPSEYNMSSESGASKPVGPWGVSMRDYFAAHATDEDAKYAAQVHMEITGEPTCSRQVARFLHADAMLAARAKGNTDANR